MARPTNSVRLMRSEASGWRAMASSAELTARPWLMPGTMVPKATTRAETPITARAKIVCVSTAIPFLTLVGPHGRTQVHDGQDGEDVGLHQAGQHRQHHQ